MSLTKKKRAEIEAKHKGLKFNFGKLAEDAPAKSK